MTSLFTRGLIALLPVLAIGCQTVESEEIAVEPKLEVTEATLTQKSAAAHQELEAIVSKAMGGKKVTLSTDTLMGETSFSVQQKQMMGPDGNPIMGRIMERPDTFTLYTDGETCSLTHEKSGETYPLTSVVCERVDP